jgi:vacuolar-type H+-ATPase subunit H
MIKKVLLAIMGVFTLFLLTALIISTVYKKEVNAYIMETANKKLNAQFSFENASIGFIKSFPLLAIDVENIKVVGKNVFAKDTLASIPNLSVQINLMKYIFDHQVEIEKVKITRANIHLLVLKDGKENWNIVKQDSTIKADTTQIQIALKKYELIESNITYSDDMRGFKTEVNNITHSGKGDFSKNIFTLETSTHAEQLSLSYLGKTYLSDVKTSLVAPIQMNFDKMEFAFKNNDLVLNELPIHFDASFAMPDSNIDMDISFSAATSPLKDFLSLVPILYQNSFKELSASGNFTLSGYMKGRMNDSQMPGFGMALKVENGAFKYEKIPAGIKHLYVDFLLDNKDGIVDHSTIQINKLQLELNNQLLQANMLVRNPSSNPYIKAKAKGNLDLGALLKIIPQKDLQLAGKIKADIELEGDVDALKKGKGFAKGNFEITQMSYLNKKIEKQVLIPEASFSITPQKLIVTTFSSKFGNSDIKATGSLENYLMYFLKNETVYGKLNMNSKLIDLNELLSLSNAADKSNSNNFELPKNIHFTTQAAIEKIIFKDFTISNASGGVAFADQQVNFNNLKFNLIDAAFNMKGVFSKKENQSPSSNIDFTIQNLSINKAYKNFSIVQKYASIAEAAQGDMNVNMHFDGHLKNDMSPDLSSVNSDGDMYINDLNLNGSPTVNKMVDLIKWAQFKNLDIKPVHLSYKIQQGRFIVNPFDIVTNITKINIKGSNGLDQSIDYTVAMDLPKQKLEPKGELNNTLNKLSQQLKVKILVRGKMQNPSLQIGTEEIAQQAKEIVKEEIKKQVNTQLEEAQKQADAIIQEASITSARIRQEAYAKADQMIAETKNPFAQMGVKLVADKLKKEADKKADKIIEDAKLKAQELINNAKAKNQ